MSRIGRKPIPVPQGVEVAVAGQQVTVKGPRGSLSWTVHPNIQCTLSDGILTVARPSDSPFDRALHGLTRALLANMVVGVTQGYRKSLEMVGVGYRALPLGSGITIQKGYSHPVEVKPPQGIALALEGGNRIIVRGVDKQQVGQLAASIRSIRPPDRYKGKGIRYANELVRLKPGKTAAAKK